MFSSLADGSRHPNGWPCRIRVCGQYETRQHGEAWGTTHLVSMRGSRVRLFTMAGIADDRHLRLVFDDTLDQADLNAPTIGHVDEVCRFVDALPADANLLVHCLQGMHRSTAVTLGILARYLPPEDAGAALHALRPMAIPNALMVGHWDAALGYDGALLETAKRFPRREWNATPRRASQ